MKTWEKYNTLTKYKESTPVDDRDDINAFQSEYDYVNYEPGSRREEFTNKLLDKKVEQFKKALLEFAREVNKDFHGLFEGAHLEYNPYFEDFINEIGIGINTDDFWNVDMDEMLIDKIENDVCMNLNFMNNETLRMMVKAMSDAVGSQKAIQTLLDSLYPVIQIVIDPGTVSQRKIAGLLKMIKSICQKSKEIMIEGVCYYSSTTADVEPVELYCDGEDDNFEKINTIDLTKYYVVIQIKPYINGQHGLNLNPSMRKVIGEFEKLVYNLK